jgi:hypothetical protein
VNPQSPGTKSPAGAAKPHDKSAAAIGACDAGLNDCPKLVCGEMLARDPGDVDADADPLLCHGELTELAFWDDEADIGAGRWCEGSHFCLLRLHAGQAPSLRILAACSRCALVLGPRDWLLVMSTPSAVMMEKPGRRFAGLADAAEESEEMERLLDLEEREELDAEAEKEVVGANTGEYGFAANSGVLVATR